MKKIPRSLLLAAACLGIVAFGIVAVRAISHRGHAVHPKAVYYCPMHPTYTSDRPGDCPICNMRLVLRQAQDAVKREEGKTAEEICLLHNCPKLHEGRPCPMVVVTKPGEEVTCPICGTHVIEGERTAQAAGPSGYVPILLSPQKQQLIGVKTAPVARKTLAKTIRTVGRIAYDPELYQAQAEYLQALRAYEKAKASAASHGVQEAKQLVEAAQLRLKILGFGQALIDEMASRDGPDQSLLLADPEGRVWVYAQVYEFELPIVGVGQEAVVEVQAIPGKRLQGVVRSIDPILDPATRTARVRAVLTDPERILRPEMFVNVQLQGEPEEVLAVPEEALFDTGTQKIVFVDKGEGLFEPREVRVWFKADGHYGILEGLEEGERVVTSGNFLIDSESRLKAALEGMEGGKGHPHGP